MIRTDLDIVRALKETGVEPSRVLAQEEILEGDRLALMLKLRMGPSQYATMALRPDLAARIVPTGEFGIGYRDEEDKHDGSAPSGDTEREYDNANPMDDRWRGVNGNKT
ncbi:hypothetical protein V1525DRAFT_385313 [Lipomyces kononenkoae]|uniref:Uncharacterized protein n=1 Tax=Lipomyces kononenkoae TaxID=34357 RepID=A0ACC3TCM4_LIPKO